MFNDLLFYFLQVFRALANILELLNYSMTFYIYCLFSEDFRNTLLRTLKWPWFTDKTNVKRNGNEVNILFLSTFQTHVLQHFSWILLQVRLTTTQPFNTQHKLTVNQPFQQHSTSGFVTGNGRSSSIWCPLLLNNIHHDGMSAAV